MGWEIFGPPAPRRPLLPTMAGPPNPESGFGPWEATASPLVQRRRKPDGSYETRATPNAIPGGKPALGRVAQADTSAKAIAASGLKLFGASVAENLATAPKTAEQLTTVPLAAAKRALLKQPVFSADTLREAESLGTRNEGLDRLYRATGKLHQEQTERFAEATQDLPAPVSAGLYGAVELGAGLVDPTNLPAAGPLKPAGAAREAVDLLDGISFKALDDGDLQSALQKGVQPVSPGYGGQSEAVRFAAWLDKHGLDYDDAERFGELPWLREKFFNLDNPDVTPPASFYGGKPGEAGHITFGSGSGSGFQAPDPRRALADLRTFAAGWSTYQARRFAASPQHGALLDDLHQKLKAVAIDLDARRGPGNWNPAPDSALVADTGNAYARLRDWVRSSGSPDALTTYNPGTGLGPQPFDPYTRVESYFQGGGPPGAAPTPAPTGPTRAHIGRDPDVDLGATEAPEPPPPLPPPPAGPVRDPQMSTKALENVAGMQDEFADLVVDNYDVVAKGRGPVRPVSVYHDAKTLADDLGMTREDFLEIAPRIGDKEVSLGKAFLGGAKQEINDLARQLADGTAPDPIAAKARLDQLSVDVVRMMANIQGRFSEGGRVLRSGQEALDPFNLATTPKDKLQLGLLKRYKDNLDEDTISLIAQLDGDPSSPDMLNFLRKMERPTFKDYRMSYWINSVLSGTKTTLRNLNGNVVRLAELTAMRPAGAVVEAALAPLQGRAPERLLRETLPATMGVFRGVPEGIKRFAFVMKNGYDPERLVAELTEGAGKKYDGRLPVDTFLLSQSRTVRGVGAVVTLPTRLLSATDALITMMANTSENYAWATRKAIQDNADDIPGRVAELILEQPEEMARAARSFGEKATYRDPMSWVGSAFASVRRGPPGADKLADSLRAQGGVGRALAPLVRAPQTVMEHILPFIHVSDRVAASVTDYIPGSKPFKLARQLAEKDPEASDLIARQVVGAGLGMLGLKWAAEGRLVGSAPRDEALRNDFYAEGKQPYSLLIGGKWVPIRDTLGPLAGPFVAAALYQDHVQTGEDPTVAITGMTLSSARYMLDASYMSTLQDVIEAVETDNSGEVGKGMTQAAARVVGGYNPYSGLQRNVATAMDPRVVEREGFTDELKSGVPGLRSELPARIGPRGEELVQATGALGGMSPVVPTENRVADPALAERVERLRYTLQGMRRKFGRTERAIDSAERGAAGEAGLAGKDEQLRSRAQQLRGELPPMGDPTAAIDATLDDVRDLEEAIRDVRANPNLDAGSKREQEIYWQQRLELLLQQSIDQLQGGGGP